MSKTILITGSTDGIGLLTAKTLAAQGHTLLLHGRSQAKLDAALKEVGGTSEGYIADFSNLGDVAALAEALLARPGQIDVLINNAGVYKTPNTRTADGLDVRFVVNTFAPWVLTQRVLSKMPAQGRVINLSSAAQAPVDLEALSGQTALDDFGAYAQSKLAITIWSQEMAASRPDGPVVIAVNPGSLLASKMVKEGFGVAGNDMRIGADILCRLALDDAFATASGKYFDNDVGRFAAPHPAAQSAAHRQQVTEAVERISKSLV